VIHTHTKWGNLITQLVDGPEFRIAGQEMIQGCEDRAGRRRLENVETLVVPIIETEINEHVLCVSPFSRGTKHPLSLVSPC
jgi:hypothetical protein